MVERLSILHAKIHDPGQRSFTDYCARADARVEFCERVIAAWPRIAAVIAAARSMRYADGGPSCVLEERLDEALLALEEKL